MNSGLGESNDVAWYKLVRDRMDNENALITQRLSWLITSQSFLFTAYSIASRKDGGALEAQLRSVVPVVAICIGILIYLAIIAGCSALKYDRELLLPLLATIKGKEPEFPHIESPAFRFWLGLVAPLLLPLLLILAWLYLLLFPSL